MIRHLRRKPLKCGRTAYYWQPSGTIAKLGLSAEALGFDEDRAKKRAVELNAFADELRRTGRRRDALPALGTVARLDAEYRASDEWKDLKERTRRDYKRWLDRFVHGFAVDEVEIEGFGDLPARVISPKILKTWRRTIVMATTDYEGYHAIGTMRALWAWAESEEWIDASPARLVKNPRPPTRSQAWTLAQCAAFLQAAFDVGQPGLGVAMLVADNIAQSPIDVFGLKAKHFIGYALKIDGRAKTGVGAGTLALWPHVASALQWYIDRRPTLHPEAPLFINDLTGKPWEESRRGKEFRAVRTAAGLPAVLQFQDLRRTAATEAVASGATGKEAQALLRHTSEREAGTYIKAEEALFASASEKRMKRRRQGNENG